LSKKQQNPQEEERVLDNKRKRISYSELKIWSECSFRHKLAYIDQLSNYVGNEYTAFGTAIHGVCENIVPDNSIDGFKVFKEAFGSELRSLDRSTLNKDLVVEMLGQSEKIIPNILPALSSHFGNYSIVSVEEGLYETINDFETNINFKGFIDLVIKTDDGVYHIIDWKSCSWGWKAQKKSEALIVYQLSLYKKFFAEKHDIDPDNIETHFALLKRTASKNNVEIFRVSNGKKRIDNAVQLLKKAIFNIKSKNFVKNRLSCRYCEFKDTAHCP
tara:strand:+ start:2303 stop:3121 length:819 start_codon:yes stop_codon:yes gene_type:complete